MYLDQTKEQYNCGGCLSLFVVKSLNPESEDLDVEYCPFCGEEIYDDDDEEELEEEYEELEYEDYDE